MANEQKQDFSRDDLTKALNEDLSREYQAIIAYVVYSQALKGAQYMAIAEELTKHAVAHRHARWPDDHVPARRRAVAVLSRQ